MWVGGPEPMVAAWDSYQRGCLFESQHRILAGSFFTFIRGKKNWRCFDSFSSCCGWKTVMLHAVRWGECLWALVTPIGKCQWPSGFMCVFHHASHGSNPNDTINAFWNSIDLLTMVIATRKNRSKWMNEWDQGLPNIKTSVFGQRLLSYF